MGKKKTPKFKDMDRINIERTKKKRNLTREQARKRKDKERDIIWEE